MKYQNNTDSSDAASMISEYNIDKSNMRPIGEDTAEHEMMIDYNGPEIGEADDVLMEALQLHFKDNPKGIHFDTHNIFGSNGLTVQNILYTKSRLPLFDK